MAAVFEIEACNGSLSLFCLIQGVSPLRKARPLCRVSAGGSDMHILGKNSGPQAVVPRGHGEGIVKDTILFSEWDPCQEFSKPFQVTKFGGKGLSEFCGVRHAFFKTGEIIRISLALEL